MSQKDIERQLVKLRKDQSDLVFQKQMIDEKINNLEKKKKTRNKRKRDNIFGEALIGNDQYSLKKIGELLKTGNATKDDFRKGHFNIDNVYTVNNGSVRDWIVKVVEKFYYTEKYCVFYDFKQEKLDHRMMTEYTKIWKDPNKISLYANHLYK
jgi:hypothetical protein